MTNRYWDKVLDEWVYEKEEALAPWDEAIDADKPIEESNLCFVICSVDREIRELAGAAV